MGEYANRTLLATLEGRLIAFGLAHSSIPEHQLFASLRGEEAKLWIHESEVEAQLSEDCPAILYPPWQHATDGGVGLLAPVGGSLRRLARRPGRPAPKSAQSSPQRRNSLHRLFVKRGLPLPQPGHFVAYTRIEQDP